jgi:hypothetical protein
MERWRLRMLKGGGMNRRSEAEFGSNKFSIFHPYSFNKISGPISLSTLLPSIFNIYSPTVSKTSCNFWKNFRLFAVAVGNEHLREQRSGKRV